MKNSQKGFIIPLLVILITISIVSGGAYFIYLNKKLGFVNKNLTENQTQTKQTDIITQKQFVVTIATTTLEKQLVNTSLTSFRNIFIIQDDGTLISSEGQVKPLSVARKFYYLNQDKKDVYDFLTLFTSFHDPNTVEYHMGLRNSVKGGGVIPISPPTDISDLPGKLIGINFVNDSYSPEYNTDEVLIKNNLFLMCHETGHQWLAYLGRDEGISDGIHYSKWTNNGFIRNGMQWGDLMSGWPWKDNGDGTLSVRSMIHQGFSNFSLYLMGFIPAFDVSDLQIVVPNDSMNKDLHNVPGIFKIITMKNIIAKYGEREPSYLNSQKNFNMAYILVVKKGQKWTDYESYLNVVNWIAKYFPDEWNYITYGKSIINKDI
ncbi:MAG: hypothetical protein C0412_11455 [Flavobacterium sp.]|nr:hypothetical protein [Flavobacterium sp.]